MVNNRERIRGRVVTKNNVNGIYPKFTVINEEPFLQAVFETWESLDSSVSPSEEVYEPLKTGLGTVTDTMYVKTEYRTFMFIYGANEITWGSEVVTFGDPVTFAGDTPLNSG